MNSKVLIAMSGGVDSSVAAYLLKQQHFDCTGVTMKMFDSDSDSDSNCCISGITLKTEKSCCSLDDVEDARSVAFRLDIPYYVYNFTGEFEKQVIKRFVEAYENGATPNPCIDCNRYIKFEKLFLRAKQLDMSYIATGHYVRTEYDSAKQRYLLRKGLDSDKDQSYVLYAMTQEQLKCALFPLGGLRKQEVREIASEQGFINAGKRDSQDICFVPDGDYSGFIERYTNKSFESGDFIDKQGNVLGRHKGLIRYTIGQRKGLGLALENPMYVCSKCTENNTVTLCGNNELYTKSLEASDFNWIAYENAYKSLRVKAKVRYKQAEQLAYAEQISDDKVHIEFDEPQRAIAKGQAVVLYDGDVVVGGGTIV